MSLRRQALVLASLTLWPLLSPLAARAAEGPTAVGSQLKPPSVSVVTAQTREVVSSVVVTGTLTARETVAVGSEVDGLRIGELLADEGDVVAAGAVLARLSTELIDIELARNASQTIRADAAMSQAESQIAEWESSVTEAEAAYLRTLPLQQKGVVGQDVLDTRTATLAAAKARLANARQGLAVAEADRALTLADRRELDWRKSRADIRTPAGGLVLSRMAKLGAVASASGGTLFEIAKDGQVELDADVSETVLASLKPGQPVTVALSGRGDTVIGAIRIVTPKVDATTRLGRIKIALPASDRLHVGAFARGTVEIARSRGVVVPQTAVIVDETKALVQVVAGGKIESRTVTLGISSGADVEVTKGLADGDVVVALAGTFVRDGDAVTAVAMQPEAKG